MSPGRRDARASRLCSARLSREGKPSTAGLHVVGAGSYRPSVTIAVQPRPWRRFLALGDSFTEGMMDDLGPDGRHRGWADDVAVALARRAVERGEDGIEYANLAVRGRLLTQVVDEQVPPALELGPDLVSLAAGINDTLRPHYDLDVAATSLDRAVRRLRAGGADVLLFAWGDPARRSAAMAPVRDRVRRFNAVVEAVADTYGCYLASFWLVAAYDDERLWAEDRLHLSPAGHRLAARTALAGLGLDDRHWRTPAVPAPPASRVHKARLHGRWVRVHLAPWVARRVRGESSGDRVAPKHPTWVTVTPG